jgi:hypothetical protein
VFMSPNSITGLIAAKRLTRAFTSNVFISEYEVNPALRRSAEIYESYYK